MKKRSKIIFSVIASIVLLGIIFWSIDRNRVFEGKTPLFAINVGINKDTNAELYYGLGYVAVRCVDSETLSEYTNIEMIFSKNVNHVCFSGKSY
jgi:hypothetical protein